MRGPGSLVLDDVGRELADGDAERGAQLTARLFREHERLFETEPVAAYDWQSITRRLASSLGRPEPFDLASRFREYAAAGHGRLVNGTSRELLEELAADGWHLVVLTNGWRIFQEPVLAGVGLLPVFERVITCEQIGYAKPAPEAFRAARGDAERYVHVGDRYDHDIEGGNAAGAETVLLRADAPETTPADRSARPPALAARTLSDLVGYLRLG